MSGAEVTILEALPQVLTGVDQQVAQTVVRAFTKRGIKVQTGVRIVGLDRTASDLSVRYEGKSGDEALSVDGVVVSVGRSPRSEGIGLEDAGVKVDERGFVAVDGNLRTNVDGVYAVGDVVATRSSRTSRSPEGIVAIKTMLGEQPAPIDYDKVPWGIYCHPEVAFCGLTEAQATQRGYDVETSVHRWGGNGRALIIGETDGMVKIVSERRRPDSRRAHRRAVGHRADRRGVPLGELGSDAGRHRFADPRAPDALGAVRRVGARADRSQSPRLIVGAGGTFVDVTMPQLGETVTEGTITRWFKQVGETVAADEPLFEVSTDKVDSEVPAPAAGVVSEILVPEGDTVSTSARGSR